MIRLTTNFGTIDIELDYKNAPVTASNFEQYVKDGHYNGLIFHRVIPGFMIQGGGFKPGMDEVDTREPIKNEANNGLYVKDGHYNGLIFHRVIPGFMIQGGGFKPGMDEVDTREPIKNEANNGLSNEKYTIAMARTNDPHSASAQFFINVADNKFLDFKSETMQGWGYAVFGKVVAGQDVVDKIAKVRTGRVGWYDDVPTEDVVIEKAEVI